MLDGGAVGIYLVKQKIIEKSLFGQYITNTFCHLDYESSFCHHKSKKKTKKNLLIIWTVNGTLSHVRKSFYWSTNGAQEHSFKRGHVGEGF